MIESLLNSSCKPLQTFSNFTVFLLIIHNVYIRCPCPIITYWFDAVIFPPIYRKEAVNPTSTNTVCLVSYVLFLNF